MDALMHYFRGSLEELRHVQWPTQQQAIRLSAIVVVFIIANAAAFGALDALFTFFLSKTL